MEVNVRRRFRVLVATSLLGASVVLVASGATSAATPLLSGTPPALGPLTTGLPGSTSITLEGALNPNGSDTTYAFHYGTTTAYGATTPSQDAGSGSALVTISAQLTGLAPGTTYHFDLVATNGGGTVASGDVTFTTTAAGATTTTLPGSAPPQPVTSASWHLVRQSVANRPGSADGLLAVSCASATFCLATGFTLHGATGDPLIERWTGVSWTIVPSPLASGASLMGVSCSSPASCLAVGRIGLDAYSEYWNGRAWQIEPAPSPKSTGSDQLSSVRCLAAGNCWAVGLKNGGTSAVAVLIEHWNGRGWSVVGAPTPSQTELSGVDCASSADCWAVGASGGAGYHARPLAEHWNGRGWSVVATPSAPFELQSVSCRSVAMCWATGNLGMLHLVGGAWRTVTASSGIGLSCASVSDCWVVGDGGSRQWNGQTWSEVASPNIPVLSPHFPPALFGVACPTTSECVVVGVINQQLISSQRAIAEVARSA